MANENYSLPNGFNKAQVLKELSEEGYTVIPGVIPHDKCDTYIQHYKEWFDRFGDSSPAGNDSLIHSFNIAHSEPHWLIRLQCKPVFAEIWGTDKLLCSMDGMAIGEPPELGRTSYNTPGENWLHIDQGKWRKDLHAYQGAVYLEETTKDDHCFRLIPGSLKYHEDLYNEFNELACNRGEPDHIPFSQKHVDWYLSKGLQLKNIPVPKGGLVLWDSRTVHDSVKPARGRPNNDRWRYVTFVCMTPAKWATPTDLELKAKAYRDMLSTAHWPSRGVWLFPTTPENIKISKKPHIDITKDHTEIGKSKMVRELVGLEPYDFDDGTPNELDWEPLCRDTTG